MDKLIKFTHRIDQSKFKLFDIGNCLQSYLSSPLRPEFFEMIWYWPKGNRLLDNNEICLIPPFRSFSFEMDGKDGFIIAFKREYLEEDDEEYALDVFNLFNAQGQWSNFSLTKEVIQNLENVFALIRYELNTDLGSYLVLKSLVKVFLLHLIRMNQNAFLPQDVNQKRVYEFCILLDRHYDTQRKASFYAGKLGISEKRLNQIMMEKMDKTVTALVHARLILEAKRQLTSSKLTIKEIAYALNFEDHSYFTRFFKKQTGLTPEEFKMETAGNFRLP